MSGNKVSIIEEHRTQGMVQDRCQSMNITSIEKQAYVDGKMPQSPNQMMLSALWQLLNESNMENLSQLTAQISAAYTGADCASLKLKHETTGKYITRAQIGEAIFAPEEQCQCAMQKGIFIFSSDDICNCLRLNKRETKTRKSVILCLPVATNNEVFGVLSVVKNGNKSKFSSNDLEVMKILTEYSSLVFERERLICTCKRQHHQLDKLLHEVNIARENERSRMASELHDSVAQWMVGVNYDIKICRALISQSRFEDLDSELIKVEKSVQRGIKEIRRVLANLRPFPLETLGLAGALRKIAERLTEYGINCVIDIDDPLPELGDVDATIYWIIQEALTNVTKHSHSTDVRFCVKYLDHTLLVNITDNGQGFYTNDVMSREASLEHIGLLGMRNRIEMLGGCINIDSSPGNGTSVVFSIPIVSMLTANS